MNRKNLLYLFLIAFLTGYCFSGSAAIGKSVAVNISQQDPLKENQILYNGKVWRNHFTSVKGDQFLFSKDYLPGSLTINGKTFTDIYLKYDIFKDEILTPVDAGGILQLNKEMVDSFSVLFQNKTYRFIKMKEDGYYTLTIPRGIHFLQFSFIGMREKMINLNLYGTGELNVDMRSVLILLRYENSLTFINIKDLLMVNLLNKFVN